MSPRKLTEDDKQEILQLYRNSEATTSTLASNYEVSSSTISRFLKNKLSSTEYEDLIQQKRLARTPRGEKSIVTLPKSSVTKKTKTKTKTKTKSLSKKKSARNREVFVEATDLENIEVEASQGEAIKTDKIQAEPESAVRRRRRRSSTTSTPSVGDSSESSPPQVEQLEIDVIDTVDIEELITEKQPNRLVIDRQPSGNSQGLISGIEGTTVSKSNSLILKGDRPDVDPDIDGEEDEDDEDLTTLKEILGEDLEDINDDDDEEEDDEDWDEEEEDLTCSIKGSNLDNVRILPLSQASLPKTCYLVIDRSAELIVKPLADFADLGLIPQEETKQRTLPVFDNHRIAKRFSNRRERVIKVPDGRMLQKTSHHLQDKGITRLLVDGQIYSLAN